MIKQWDGQGTEALHIRLRLSLFVLLARWCCRMPAQPSSMQDWEAMPYIVHVY